jgi:hypothetical protein
MHAVEVAGGNGGKPVHVDPPAVNSRRVLARVKGLVLAMLENRPAPIFCAWLRSRRASKGAAPLTRSALPADLTAGRLQGMGLFSLTKE